MNSPSLSSERIYDVAIVGGGIIGCAIAYNLALRHARVIVLEQARIAAQQSSRAWGFIRQQGRHTSEIPLAARACEIWQTLEQELDADLEYRRSGILLAAENEQDEVRLRAGLQAARESGIQSELIDADEISRLLPGARHNWRSGLLTRGDGHAEPAKACVAFAEAARRLGVTLMEGVRVNALRRVGTNGLSIRTEIGDLSARHVVVAAGVGSAELMAQAGISIPVQPVRASVAQTMPSELKLALPVWSPSVAFRPKQDRSFYVSNGYRGVDAEYDLGLHSFRHFTKFLPVFLANRGVINVSLGRETLRNLRHQLRHHHLSIPNEEPLVNGRLTSRNLHEFFKLFPQLRDGGIKRTWAGRIDATPDLIPIISRCELEDLYLVTGFNGHGFALAPAVGQAVCELILDGRSLLGIEAFRLSRFGEGFLDRQFNAM